jgi:hypothetical protein
MDPLHPGINSRACNCIMGLGAFRNLAFQQHHYQLGWLMSPFIVIGLIAAVLLLLWWGHSCSDSAAELALPALLIVWIGLVMIFDMKPGGA